MMVNPHDTFPPFHLSKKIPLKKILLFSNETIEKNPLENPELLNKILAAHSNVNWMSHYSDGLYEKFPYSSINAGKANTNLELGQN